MIVGMGMSLLWAPGPRAEEIAEIYGCVHKDNDRLRVVKEPGACRRNENGIVWSVQGPPGEQGPPGTIPNADVHRVADLLGEPDLAGGLPAGVVQAAGCSATLGLTGLEASEIPVAGMIGAEGISRLSDYRVLAEGEPDDAWLGMEAAVEFASDHGSASFPGIVTEVVRVGESGGSILTALTIAPAVAPLSLNRNYRIYQDRSVDDIVEEILSNSAQPFELRLFDTPPTRAMVVQYRESDFNFVSRLAEAAGISFFFEQDGTMVVTDSNTGFADEGGIIIFGDGVHAKADHGDPAASFRLGGRLTAASATVIGFNFELPELSVVETAPAGGGDPKVASFGQSIASPTEAATLAAIDLDRALVRGGIGGGTSTSTAVRAGHIITMEEAPSGRFDGEYLVTATRHIFTRDGDGCVGYANTFKVTPSDVSYRPPRTTPRPVAHGVQTATVVGPPGEEIFPDEYGRVKVQFHWDREGTKDDSSSAWLRVAIPLGRLDFSPAFIPEIDDEVLVSFEQGDPSRPVIVGSMYNGNDRPPE
jgi:type VI secretion system secreted protein VgrG